MKSRGCGDTYGRLWHVLPRFIFFTFYFSLFIYLTGCVTPKANTPYLLTAQTVRGNRNVATDELESLIPQKPNRRILGLPITPPLWFYQFGQRRYDRDKAVRELQAKTNEFEQQSQLYANQPRELKRLNRRYGRELKKLRLVAEEGNGLMRNLGEPPTYFVERDAQANVAKMQSYLANKGFFRARASFTLDTLRRKQVRVNYVVHEGVGFYLRNINYEIADPRVDSIVRQSLGASGLRSGDRYDFSKLTAEKVRLETLLRDRGYYAFSRQYIAAIDVDTNRIGFVGGDSLRRPVDVYIPILNPPGQATHPIYQFGDVEVRIGTDADAVTGTQANVVTAPDTVSRNGITYLLNGRSISARLLDSKIRIRPGALYSQTNYRDTQRQLFLLNQFKFVNVNITDTTNRRLRTLITASPVDKYEYTFEGGLFVLYQTQTTTPGPFGNLTFRVRNLFGGLETFETSVRFGVEAQTGFNTGTGRDVYRATELGVTTSLTFPQILLPGRFRFRFNPYNPRTQISLGFTNTQRPDFRRSLLRSTMAYNWQTSSTKQFSFLIADVNLINAGVGLDRDISALFQQQLRQDSISGGTLFLSFRRSFASGISMAYTYNTNTVGQNRRANFFRAVAESGGTTLNFFRDEQLRRFFNTANTERGLQYYKYLRLSLDYRHYIPLRPRTTLAFRVNSGLVYGYGPGGAAPYEKLFFAGGSNSIRAWLPRRLGPGASFPVSTTLNPNEPVMNENGQLLYTFERPGDFLLEGSAELRGRLFKLFADVDGAVFIDAGNVWRLPNRGGNPRGEFQLNTFIPQIAVGTGVGLRLDFSFFIVRFDGGIKVWDPARQYVDNEGVAVDNRFILPKFSLRQLSRGANPLVINFGIGYPF